MPGRIPSVLVFAALCASCTMTTRVPKDAAPSSDEGIFVIGSAPANFRVWISNADLTEKDGATTVKQDIVGIPVLVANPENGFLIGRVRGGSTLMISGVRMVTAEETFGQGFSACGGTQTPVFNVPAGKTIYVGHVALSAKGKDLFARYSEDFAAARRHVDANYPNLRGKVERHGLKLVTTAPCPKGQTMVITVPGR